jgi:hypothetical protein
MLVASQGLVSSARQFRQCINHIMAQEFLNVQPHLIKNFYTHTLTLIY